MREKDFFENEHQDKKEKERGTFEKLRQLAGSKTGKIIIGLGAFLAFIAAMKGIKSLKEIKQGQTMLKEGTGTDIKDIRVRSLPDGRKKFSITAEDGTQVDVISPSIKLEKDDEDADSKEENKQAFLDYVAKDDLLSALETISKYPEIKDSIDNFDKLLEQIVREAVDIYQLEILEYLDLFKDEVYAFEVIKKVVEFNDELGLEHFEKIKDQSYAKMILEDILRRKRGFFLVFKYFEKFKDQFYASDILGDIIENAPNLILHNPERIQGVPGAEEYVKRAAISYAKESPKLFLERFLVKYLDKDFIDLIIQDIANNNADIMKEYLSQLKEDNDSDLSLIQEKLEKTIGSLENF